MKELNSNEITQQMLQRVTPWSFMVKSDVKKLRASCPNENTHISPYLQKVCT